MAKHKIHYERKPKFCRRAKGDGPPFFFLKVGWNYRHITTQNERRQNCAAEVDGSKVRGKRKWKQVPSFWDDRGIQRWRVGSWKDGTRCRKQWEMNLK